MLVLTPQVGKEVLALGARRVREVVQRVRRQCFRPASLAEPARDLAAEVLPHGAVHPGDLSGGRAGRGGGARGGGGLPDVLSRRRHSCPR
jgi:hypothetical protein